MTLKMEKLKCVVGLAVLLAVPAAALVLPPVVSSVMADEVTEPGVGEWSEWGPVSNSRSFKYRYKPRGSKGASSDADVEIRGPGGTYDFIVKSTYREDNGKGARSKVRESRWTIVMGLDGIGRGSSLYPIVTDVEFKPNFGLTTRDVRR